MQPEIRCFKCKKVVDEDEIVWINPYTGEATWEYGEPFHVECAPAQYPEPEERKQDEQVL